MFAKRTISLILPLIFLAACTSGSSGKAPGANNANNTDLESKLKSGKKLASQDGVEVYEGYLELLETINPNIQSQMKSAVGKKRLVDNLLEQELLYRESLKKGIQNKPKYREKAALYERVIIAQGLLEEEIDEKAKTYYDENKEKEFSQVEVAHILIRTRKPMPGKADDKGVSDEEALAKAKEAKTKLDNGVAWEEVVKEYSDDRLTQSRGGSLGKLNRDDRRAARLGWEVLIDQAFKMKTGDVSEPLKAKDGYHIIKVTEAAGVAPYEEVEARIKFKLRGPVKKEVLSELGGDEKITYFEEDLQESVTPEPKGGIKTAPGGVKPDAPSADQSKPKAVQDHGKENS